MNGRQRLEVRLRRMTSRQDNAGGPVVSAKHAASYARRGQDSQINPGLDVLGARQ